MSLWTILAVVLLLVVLARVDSRDRSARPTRSWNIWFGPKPREGEQRFRYTLRRALAALAVLVVVTIPLFFASSPLDEGTSFSGDGSIMGMAVFTVFTPLSAMAFVTLVAQLFSALVSMVFRRSHVFRGASGEFVRS